MIRLPSPDISPTNRHFQSRTVFARKIPQILECRDFFKHGHVFQHQFFELREFFRNISEIETFRASVDFQVHYSDILRKLVRTFVIHEFLGLRPFLHSRNGLVLGRSGCFDHFFGSLDRPDYLQWTPGKNDSGRLYLESLLSSPVHSPMDR